MAYATEYRAEAHRSTGLFADLAGRWARYKVYRNTLAELEALSDRELADLALSRLVLRSVAYEAAYGR